jgi:hypothetical protein
MCAVLGVAVGWCASSTAMEDEQVFTGPAQDVAQRFEARMRARRVVAPVTVLGLFVGLPASADARTYGVPCRLPTGALVFEIKPRKCTLGGRFGYQQVNLRRIRWRSWGSYSSRGRGIWEAGMGYRERTRFVVYRPRRCEGDFFAYTRARGLPPSRWRLRLRWRC